MADKKSKKTYVAEVFQDKATRCMIPFDDFLYSEAKRVAASLGMKLYYYINTLIATETGQKVPKYLSEGYTKTTSDSKQPPKKMKPTKKMSRYMVLLDNDLYSHAKSAAVSSTLPLFFNKLIAKHTKNNLPEYLK